MKKKRNFLAVVLVLAAIVILYGTMFRLHITRDIQFIKIEYVQNHVSSSIEIKKTVDIENAEEIQALIGKINRKCLWKIPGNPSKSWDVDIEEVMVHFWRESSSHFLAVYEDGTIIFDNREYINIFSKKEGKELYDFMRRNFV